MAGRVTVLRDVRFNNPNLPRITLPEITEQLRGSVSTLATTAQQFTAALSLGVVYSAGVDGKIWRYDAQGNATLVAQLGGRILGMVADGQTLYATQDQSGRVWRVNALTGATLDWAGVGATALALSADRLTLYAVALDGTLGAINIATGGLTQLGNMGQAGAIGLAYDAVQGLLYTSTHPLLLQGNPAPAALYRTQLSSMTTTQVVPPGNDIGPVWGCTLGGNGVYLYQGSFSGDGRVWRWDTRTTTRPVLLAGAVELGRVDGTGAAARFANPTPVFGEGRLLAVHGHDTGGVREIR